AHSEIFMIGTFATLFTLHGLGVDGPRTGLSLVGVLAVCALAAMAASGGAAVVLERLAYRPLRRRGASRLAALISAIGASFFLLGGAMAGVAAVLYSIKFETTRFDVGFVLGIKAFTAAVLGGIGNLRGALLGGLALGLMENYGASVFGSQWKDVIAFVLLVGV